MASLKEVRNRINSVKSTQQITKAMKMVAAAKLRRSQDRIIQMRPYAKRLNNILANVTANIDENIANVFGEERTPNHILLVLITSDRGLCGGFNTNIIRAASSLMNEKYQEQAKKGNVKLLCVGKKGRDFFQRRKFDVNGDFTSLFEKLSFENVRKAAEFAMSGFQDKQFDRIEIIYNEFKNVATQIVRTEQFLPIAKQAFKVDAPKKENTDYVFEPSIVEIVDDLLPKTLKIQFYKALLESNASENGARMTAMDKATENAGEMLKELRLIYNRSRQASITKEILEIVGGAEALASA